jgi:pimeloyl-ACP methyl ester carboxylesterase
MPPVNSLPPCLTGHACGVPVTLAEAQRRFEQEATRGVCDTGRYRASFFAWGDGPPILLVPGLSNRGEVFLLLAALLSKHYRCLSYDLPLGGADGAKLRRYTHDALTADALDLLDHLGVRQAYLYGASFGSTIVLRLLHDHPERFPRGIIQGGFARRPLAPAERLLAKLARYWPGSMNRLPLREWLVRQGHHAPFASQPSEVWRFFLRDDRPIAAVATHALLLHSTDIRSLLSSIRQPVLLVCGEHDPLVGSQCEEILMDGLPNAGRVEIPGSGHVPYLSHPDTLADVIRDFLTPVGVVSSQ